MNRYLDILRATSQTLGIRRVSPDTVNTATSDQSPLESRDPQWMVRIAQKSVAYSIWEGERLDGHTIAIDTETTCIQDREIPGLALISVSDGDRNLLMRPGQVAEFLTTHAVKHFVAHNAAFDFWVIDRFLANEEESDARAIWWSIADDTRLHDTMLLDQLIRLGQKDDPPRPRDLSIIARTYAGMVLDKDDPYRLRYHEIIGQDIVSIDRGFLEYAIKDAVATHRAYQGMLLVARRLIREFEDQILPDATRRFGHLTEALQVQGAIALFAAERRGLQLDREQVQHTQQKLCEQISKVTASIEAMKIAEDVFKRDKHGAIKLAPKSQAPSVNKGRLEAVLQRLADTAEESIQVPRTAKTDALTMSVKFWSRHRHLHPFIAEWVNLSNLGKLHQFLSGLQSDRIYPRYNVLMRTGRTSCTSPNIQQLPRSSGFREMVAASPGHYLFAIDYSAIELRVLAAICEHRYGESKLAAVIRAGTDPHVFTAAMFEGLNLDNFMVLKRKDPERFARLRQQAKALNFGIPGGLGPASLVSYAATTYGVNLSLDEAEAFRDKLIAEVYPELSLYLREDPQAILARNLGASPSQVRACFRAAAGVRNVVRGHTEKWDGTPYDEAWCTRVWDNLLRLNKQADLVDDLTRRVGSERLCQRLFWSPSITLTGRIRARVSYSQARNTPFQGLAADGAKRALWKLTMAGYRCVAFVHDEVVIELPVDADHAGEAKRIETIMCESMQEFTGNVPVACEYALAEKWYKQAKAVYSSDGELMPWEPSRGSAGQTVSP